MRKIDFSTASWQRTGAEKYASLVICGDWAPIRGFAPFMAAEPEYVYGDTLPLLRSADCRIVNLECTLADGQPVVKAGPNLKGGIEHLPCFDLPGFNVATIGNNHSLDFGEKALAETIKLLDRRGVAHTGAGMNINEASKPALINVKGIRVGIINFTEGNDRSGAGDSSAGVFSWNIELVIQQIRSLRKECDLLLVIPHCGMEYIPFPPAYIQRAYRQIADAGADAVIAHHPHVVQGVEFHNQKPIFYSLGNYIFHQPVNHYHRKNGMILELSVDKGGKIAGFNLHPFRLYPDKVKLLTGEDYCEFTNLLQELSAPLPEDGVAAWHGVLKEMWYRGHTHESLRQTMLEADCDPQRWAAKVLNKITTSCHREYLAEITTRIIENTIDDAPEKYFRISREYFARRIEEKS